MSISPSQTKAAFRVSAKVSLLCMTAICLLGSSSHAEIIFIDDFEATTVPSGDPPGYFSFGNQLSDRGVSNSFGATSGSNSAFYVINFSLEASDAFGVGAAHQGLTLSLDSNHLISAQVRIQSGLVSGGFIGFRIADHDGTVVRTADSDLFAANNNFQEIMQSLTSLNHIDFTGKTAGLDYSHITSVGLLFFDRSFSGTTTVVFDDLKITAVPEPSSALLLISAGIIAALYRRHMANQPPRLAFWLARPQQS